MPRKTSLEGGAEPPKAPKPAKVQESAMPPATAPPIATETPSTFAQMLDPLPPVAGTSEPIAVRSANDSVRDPDQPTRIMVDVLDPITQQIGAKFWRTNPVFDWCRQPGGYRHRFTRYYFEQRVLLDIFAGKNASVEKEVAQKTAAIAQENAARKERGEAPIGYLPIVRGANVPFEAFEAVLRGETLPLQVKRDAAMMVGL